jgi:hypothetical protein
MARGLSVKVKKTGRIKEARFDFAGLTRVGILMVDNQLHRWSLGLNASGNPAKPLSKKSFFEKRAYFKKKGITRAVIRDNRMTDALYMNFSLRKAIAGYIRAEPTQRDTRAHATRAQQQEEMIGFAGYEQIQIFEKAHQEYGKVFTKAWIPIVNA